MAELECWSEIEANEQVISLKVVRDILLKLHKAGFAGDVVCTHVAHSLLRTTPREPFFGEDQKG